MRKKVVDGYPDYEVYNDGRVWSNKRNKFLKCVKNNSGYETVNLYRGSSKDRRTCLVHRLVAEAFVKNPKGFKEVNHKNGIKTDNHYKNLEWCTHPDNMNHAYINGLDTKQKAVRCTTTGKTYRSCCEAERRLKLDHRQISDCCSGKQKTHKGMKFEYV